MKEIEITFKKRFTMRDDQNPQQCARMYIETMGFTVVGIEEILEEILNVSAQDVKNHD